MMPVLRILHVSDIHYSRRFPEKSPSGVSNVLQGATAIVQRRLKRRLVGHKIELLEALAEWTCQNEDQYDCVLITGDLAATGEAVDLEEVFEIVYEPSPGRRYRSSKDRIDGPPRLNSAGKPIWVVPGNHDRFQGAMLRPGGTEFDRVFAAHWDVGQGVKAWFTQGKAVLFVAADFTLHQSYGSLWPPFNYLSRGDVATLLPAAKAKGTQNSSELEIDTKRGREENPDCIVLWVLHFDPTENSRYFKLLNRALLSKAIAAARPDAILCGHVHEWRDADFDGVPVYVCGSATQAERDKKGRSKNDCALIVVSKSPGSDAVIRRIRIPLPF